MDKFEQLEKLSELREKRILSEEEFQKEKEKILHNDIQHKQSYIEDDTRGITNIDTIKQKEIIYDKKKYENFSSFEGRVSRLFYWSVIGGIFAWFIILIFITEGINSLTNIHILSRNQDLISGLLYMLWAGGSYWCIFITSIKRFHDMNQTGWLIFVPLYNFIGPAFIEGTHGLNKYGPDPIER